ncbi:MAG TPA: PspC domain-containing protein [Actinomycetota bacterium]|nr:PspC domain-containing protein [Actinomycetota bacterium]
MSETRPTRQPRRLVRRTDDKIVAGVCSGLGYYFGVDPLLFRIGFVVLGITGLAGVLVYLGIWAFVPAAGEAPVSSDRRRRLSVGIGILLLCGAGLLLLPIFFGVLQGGVPGTPFGFFDFQPEPVALAVVLIVVGGLLLRQREVPVATAAPGTVTVPASAVEGAAPVTFRPARERSALTAFTLAAALLLVGTAALLSSTGNLSIDIGQLTALALFVVGIGLVVGAWWGRGRLLIAFGVLLIPVVLASSVVDLPLRAGVGSTYLYAHGPEDIRYIDHAFGSYAVDFSEYRFSDGATDRLTFELGAGQLTLIVPRGVYTEVDIRARMGQAFVFNTYDDGPGIALQETFGDPTSDKRLAIDVEAGLTSISVYRSGGPRRVHRRADDKGRSPESGRAGRRSGRRTE